MCIIYSSYDSDISDVKCNNFMLNKVEEGPVFNPVVCDADGFQTV